MKFIKSLLFVCSIVGLFGYACAETTAPSEKDEEATAAEEAPATMGTPEMETPEEAVPAEEVSVPVSAEAVPEEGPLPEASPATEVEPVAPMEEGEMATAEDNPDVAGVPEQADQTEQEGAKKEEDEDFFKDIMGSVGEEEAK